jgi:toxin-antitoxin system PIN domain toxin
VIAADTNILVYAHRRDSGLHEPAADVARELAESRAPWAIPWICLREFYSVCTHPRIYDPPSTPPQACAQIDAWLESPSLTLLGEGRAHWQALRDLLLAGQVAGPLVHDAAIAAVCLAHGVRELWSVDRDFSRFPALRVRNPLR